jgi:predicted Ser/Thr protein kinase
MYKKIKKIAKGWSSYIWIVEKAGKKFIRKEVREKSNRKNLAEREGKMLKLANTVRVGPKLIEINFEKNFVIMEYVKGKKFLDFVSSTEFEQTNSEKIYDLTKEIYKQCLALDKIGLTHSQLQVGKNILVTKKIINDKNDFKKINYNTNKKNNNENQNRKFELFPTIIDFEKASLRTDGKEKNIGQIESFLFYNPNGFVAKKIRKKLNLKI